MKISSLSLKDTGRIYLDHNATTAPLKSVIDHLAIWANEWGNPSSIHNSGRGPKLLFREARLAIASFINCHPLELIFTSGGSESNNLVIKGFFDSNSKRNEYITTKIEHPSVKKSFEYLESRGAVVHYLDVNRLGEVDLATYKKLLSDRTALVSVMFANNETGSLLPIREMAALAHAVGAKFHTDAVQGLGKLAVDVQEWGVDFATFSAHKFYSLKGTGLVYTKKGERLLSQISGGGQERGRRAGTENILSVASLAHVCTELRSSAVDFNQSVQKLRDLFESLVLGEISGVQLTGAGVSRLPNTSSLIIDDIDGESLLINLDIAGVSVSTGAACSSGSPEPSPVLLAMGLTRAEAQRSLRVSLGISNTEAEVIKFVEILKETVARLRVLRSETRAENIGEAYV